MNDLDKSVVEQLAEQLFKELVIQQVRGGIHLHDPSEEDQSVYTTYARHSFAAGRAFVEVLDEEIDEELDEEGL